VKRSPWSYAERGREGQEVRRKKLDTSPAMERSRALPSRNEWGERRRFTNEWHFRYLHKERVMFEA